MSHNRMGVMGHYYGGMLDIYSDLTLQSSAFGTHIEMLEVDELSALRREVGDAEIAARVALFQTDSTSRPTAPRRTCSRRPHLRRARPTGRKPRISARWPIITWAPASRKTKTTLSSIILGNSLLTARGCPVAGELEIKNVQAMKILDILGAGGSFTEYYAVDWNDDVVLMGHDGPGHIAIAQGRTKVRPLTVYHGKVGKGLSVEMSVKHGPVTLLSVVETADNRSNCSSPKASPSPVRSWKSATPTAAIGFPSERAGS